MRIVFFGTAAFAVPSLEALNTSGQTIALCVTQPDRPQGRGLRLKASPVKDAAMKHRLSIAQPERLGEFLPQVRAVNPELGIVISYGNLIPGELLRAPIHGMLGLHPSLLPKYRGASPIAWAILQGEPVTGVTVFRLNEQLDAGEVLLQRSVTIEPRDTTASLSDRLAHTGARLLVEAVEAIARGGAAATPQDERRATYAPKLTKAQGTVDWRESAISIERLVRAVTPWPGASTSWKGAAIKLWVTRVAELDHAIRARPGEVIRVSSDGLLVATGVGALLLEELQPAGKRRMNVREFLAGHPIQVGEILGSGKVAG